MSYWTYSDLFEEPGPPHESFHGGFGLLNREGIRKPAFFAYKYLHALAGQSLASQDPQAFLSTKDGNFSAVLWDFEQPDQKQSNRSFYTKLVPSHAAPSVQLAFAHLSAKGEYRLEVYRTGYRRNDALSEYIELGMPKDLAATQLAHMQAATSDLPETNEVVEAGADGTLVYSLPMKSNDIALVTLTRVAK